MIACNLESSPLWDKFIQIASDGYADHDSPFTDPQGNAYICSMTQGVASPLQDCICTEFSQTQAAPGDALFTIALYSNNGRGVFGTDSGKTLLPNLVNFVYSGKFYVDATTLPKVGAIELDVELFLGSASYVMAHQLRIMNTNGSSPGCTWDLTKGGDTWIPTMVRSSPIVSVGWNEFSLQMSRDAGSITYQQVTLNGVTSIFNTTYPVAQNAVGSEQAGWYGLSVNFQTDGMGSPFSVYGYDLALQYS